MQVDYQTMVLTIVAVLHSIFIAATTYRIKKSKSKRRKILWKLTFGDGVLFLGGLIIFRFLLSPQSVLTLLSGMVYIIAGSFILVIEIPGYLLLSQYDEKVVGYLTKLRKDLVSTSYSFDHVNNLKASMSESLEILANEQLDSLLHDFIRSCERMRNIDRNFFMLVLTEITGMIKVVSERGKHPFPKLADILSLAGLSFLLAQFLKLLD